MVEIILRGAEDLLRELRGGAANGEGRTKLGMLPTDGEGDG
jgi:hypothetical protein